MIIPILAYFISIPFVYTSLELEGKTRAQLLKKSLQMTLKEGWPFFVAMSVGEIFFVCSVLYVCNKVLEFAAINNF